MESLIGTVRNVGYRFTVADTSDEVKEKEESEARRSSET
jgi:DNA-binding winged helix-turn-helix (wHTH) protein